MKGMHSCSKTSFVTQFHQDDTRVIRRIEHSCDVDKRNQEQGPIPFSYGSLHSWAEREWRPLLPEPTHSSINCWNLWDLDSLCTSFPKTQPDWKEHTEITMLHSKCVSLLDLGTSDLHSAVSWHVHTGEPKAWIDPISHVSNNDFQNLFSSSVQNCVDTLFKFCFQIAWAFVISSWYPLRCQPLHFNTVCSALPFDSYILCLVCSIQTYWWEVFPTT